jgi:hypothetical protein
MVTPPPVVPGVRMLDFFHIRLMLPARARPRCRGRATPGLQICAVSHVPWNRIPDLSSSGEYGLDRRRIAPSRSASNRDCCMNKDLAAVSGCPGRAMPATSSKPTFRRRQSPKAGKPSHRVTTPRSLRRHLTRRTAAYRPWKANATNTRAVLRCQPIWLRLVADC